MPQFIPLKPRPAAAPAGGGPRGELRLGDGPPQRFALGQTPLLLGAASLCDLRLPDYVSPPLLALLTPTPEGVAVRRLLDEPKVQRLGSFEPCSLLREGETLQVGPCRLQLFGLTLPTASAIAPQSAPPLDEARQALEAARRQFEDERRDWEQDAERQAEALALRSRQTLEREKELARQANDQARREATLAQNEADYSPRAEALTAGEIRLKAALAETETARVELGELRDQLYQQYRGRRDHALALKASVEKAAAKVQAQKREAEALAADLGRRQEELEAVSRAQALAAREAQVKAEKAEAQFRLVEEWQRELEAGHQSQRAALAAREQTLATAEADLAQRQRQHHEDLARLDRLNAALDEKQAATAEAEAALLAERNELARTAADLEGQAGELKQWQETLEKEAHALVQRGDEQQARQQEAARQLAEAEAKLQEALALRRSLETLKSEVEKRERLLSDRRWRVEEAEVEIRDQSRKLADDRAAFVQAQADWEAGIQAEAEQRRRMAETVARFEELEAELRERGQKLAEQEQALSTRAIQLDRNEQEFTLRGDRLGRQRQRLAQEWRLFQAERRQLESAEAAREQLQAQLQRRADLLAQQEAALAAKAEAIAEEQRQRDGAHAAWAAERERQHLELAEAGRHHAEAQRQLAEKQETLAVLRTELESRQESLAATLSQHETQQADLAAAVEALATERERLADERRRFAEELPQKLSTARGMLDQLASARGQLREQLDQIHGHAQASHGELDQLRGSLQELNERLRSEAAQLAKERGSHRLEVGRFKLFLSDWHEQWSRFRAAIEADQAELKRREAELVAEAQRLQSNSSQLELRMERLGGQEQEVAVQRSTLNRHFGDLQHWHQQKVHELAEKHLLEPLDEEAVIVPLHPGLTEADRQLAEMLRAAELADEEALEQLFTDARRLRCPLREAILNGGYLTAFQLERIESGRLEELFVGDYRLLEELRAGPPESIYRVFAPEAGEALLRRLGADTPPERQADYRGRFQAAAQVRHENVAGILAVLETAGGLAVLQEWPQGLPSDEWRTFASSPRVWLRLLRQATRGLAAIHAQGQTHGRLHAGRVLLTPEGTIKLCGLGEPAWLLGEAPPRPASPGDDLRSLGKIAFGWLTGGQKNDAVADASLLSLLRRFDEPQVRAGMLVELLDAFSRQLGGDETAWDRLLAFVRARVDATSINSAEAA